MKESYPLFIMSHDRENNPDYPEEYRQWYVVYLGKRFHVTRDVLIPRLETEVLIKRAQAILRKEREYTLLDIGTGSGIIPLSLAPSVNRMVYATDISAPALEQAKENARLQNLVENVTFFRSDLLEEVPWEIYRKTPLLITANLPYVKAGDWEHMSPDTRYEPAIALFGWHETGFEIYERLFEEIRERELTDTILLVEFWHDQHKRVASIMKKYPAWKYTFFRDYRGIERFMEIFIP